MKVEIDHAGTLVRRGGRCRSTGAPTPAERPVLADEQVQVRPLFAGELQEEPLAVGVLEPLAVTFEEPVRRPLAPDGNHQRLIGPTPRATWSAPAANRPLAAPLKNRNVGRDSSRGSCASSRW